MNQRHDADIDTDIDTKIDINIDTGFNIDVNVDGGINVDVTVDIDVVKVDIGAGGVCVEVDRPGVKGSSSARSTASAVRKIALSKILLYWPFQERS